MDFPANSERLSAAWESAVRNERARREAEELQAQLDQWGTDGGPVPSE